jgi:hypothetical protein
MSGTNLKFLVAREPHNPHLWTELVQNAEQSQDYAAIVDTYRGFLECFPLLHIYWNKWALFVQQNGKDSPIRESLSIFERSVAPATLQASVEMWHSYCDFLVHHDVEIPADEIRATFQRALDIVGSDYPSDTIWSLYIQWEQEKSKWDNVSALFCRVLDRPIRNLASFWKSFAEHANHHSIESAATPQEKSEIDAKLNMEAEDDVTLTADVLVKRMQQMIFAYRRRSYGETLSMLGQKELFEKKI